MSLVKRLNDLVNFVIEQNPDLNNLKKNYAIGIVAKTIGKSHQALKNALDHSIKKDETFRDYINIIEQKYSVTYNDTKKSYKEHSEYAIISDRLDFSAFIDEVLSLPKEMDIEVKIIGIQPSLIVGQKNIDTVNKLKKMIAHCKSVRILLPKPGSRFMVKNLYALLGEKDRISDFNRSIEGLNLGLMKMDEIKKEYNNEDKFDFRLYSSNPTVRLFIHPERIFSSSVFNIINNDDVFATVYKNDNSTASVQLNKHFDTLWAGTKEEGVYQQGTKYNLRDLEEIKGIYKVYTYGHVNQMIHSEDTNDKIETLLPAITIGALEIADNGKIEQLTYLNEGHTDKNKGWVYRVGDTLFMEVRNSREPKFTAFSIVRVGKGFIGLEEQYLFGVVVVPKKDGGIPIGMRIIFEKQKVGTLLQSLPIIKLPLSQEISSTLVPPSIRKFFSGTFRNMIGYHLEKIFDATSLERESLKGRAKLGKIFFKYAVILKSEGTDEVKIIEALRWALTHGYDDFEKVKKEFENLLPKDPTTWNLFQLICRDK